MPKTPSSSRNTSPAPVDTPVHRVSRRQRGLPPETPTTDAATMTSTQDPVQAPTPSTPIYCTVQNPLMPSPFHGAQHEDVDDWLSEFERVAAINYWDDAAKLRNVYTCLKDGAKTWFLNRDDVLTSWREFQRRLLETYRSPDRRERAERALQSRIQMPNETVSMYVEDMTRLFKRADPAMAEEKKLRHLMRGVKEQLFAGLVRSPPKSVAEFLTEAATMERVLHQRSAQFDRQVNAASTPEIFATPGSKSPEWIREIIRSVVREEMEKMYGTRQIDVGSITSVIRDEVQQVLHAHRFPPTSVDLETAPVSTDSRRRTYAEALRSATPLSGQGVPIQPVPHVPIQTVPHVPIQTMPYVPIQTMMPSVAIQSAHADLDIDSRRTPTRKSDLWRTPDRRPLCYHCGEAGHIYRECPYRQLGLRGFSVNSPRPRIGQRPRDIEEYLAQQRAPFTRRQSRSPSPRRPAATGPRFGVTARERSPSPRREN